MEKDIAHMNDHDLLVTMHEQIKGIKNDIKDLKDGTSTKLTDHENRIRALEKWVWIAIGGLAVMQLVLRFVKF